GGEEIEFLDAKGVEQKMGVPPERIIDLLALMGDASDNVPGIPGVGPKTAVDLIKEYDSVEKLLEAAPGIKKEKLRDNVLNHRDDILLSRKLVTIDTAVSFDWKLEDFKRRAFDPVELKDYFIDMEFRALLKFVGEMPEQKEEVRYETVKSLPDLKKLTGLVEKERKFAFDTETTALDPLEADLAGISLAVREKEAFYVPVGHKEGKNLPLTDVLEILKPALSNPQLILVGQNIKYDYQVMKRAGLEIENRLFDTMLTSYLLDPSSRQHGLNFLALKHFNHAMIPISDLIGTGKKQKSFAETDIGEATEYSAEDADFTLRLEGVLEPKLREAKLDDLYWNIEAPLIPVLVRVEANGVKLNTELLAEMSGELQRDLEKLAKKIYDLAWHEFNINSPQQLGKVLFEELRLKSKRKTAKKASLSTDVGVLEDLAKEHELPRLILDYRSLFKLKSTYVDALPTSVKSSTGRLHTSYNQTIAATGRLSSVEPNLQNIPIRTERGGEIRKAFVPSGPDYQILSADYSQIELRLLAHYAEDEAMIAAFNRDEDIHARTAAEVFGVSPGKITSEQRRVAKIANFSIVYGGSAYGLAQQTEMDPKDAKLFMQTYFARYPGVKEFQQKAIAQAREEGFVTTLLGRRRFIPEINSENFQLRSFAERTAINTPLQGSAADVIKAAMIAVDAEMVGKKSKMILQVHDELVFDAHQSELAWLKAMVKEKMEGVIQLKVPLKVDIGTGPNWLEAKA
ncbi:MAG TPA: DNA polymerase I, partial [candidate division Zixibacteria bacterium]|nr:DNA polymerase I [candidate division Zixibacteria bacterium]